MSDHFAVSSINRTVIVDGEPKRLLTVEINDLARAFCGALFLALPLHFTMEMWALARTIPAYKMIIIVVAGYLLNVCYHYFSGFNNDVPKQQPWFDAFTSMGVGLVASAITMLLIDQLTYQMSTEAIINCVVLEMVPTSFGASLAKSQLSGDLSKREDLTNGWGNDKKKLLGATLGAVMFAFNVASTQEPVVIATSVKSLQLIGILLFSLWVSYLMINIAQFKEREEDDGRSIMGPIWAETTICYVISLLVSAALLWMFGYLTTTTPANLWVPWVVVLSYATTLGGAAGRLVI